MSGVFLCDKTCVSGRYPESRSWGRNFNEEVRARLCDRLNTTFSYVSHAPNSRTTHFGKAESRWRALQLWKFLSETRDSYGTDLFTARVDDVWFQMRNFYLFGKTVSLLSSPSILRRGERKFVSLGLSAGPRGLFLQRLISTAQSLSTLCDFRGDHSRGRGGAGDRGSNP